MHLSRELADLGWWGAGDGRRASPVPCSPCWARALWSGHAHSRRVLAFCQCSKVGQDRDFQSDRDVLRVASSVWTQSLATCCGAGRLPCGFWAPVWTLHLDRFLPPHLGSLRPHAGGGSLLTEKGPTARKWEGVPHLCFKAKFTPGWPGRPHTYHSRASMTVPAQLLRVYPAPWARITLPRPQLPGLGWTLR